jgi:ABC-type phosphate/phosphonate transport system permease subunit
MTDETTITIRVAITVIAAIIAIAIALIFGRENDRDD